MIAAYFYFHAILKRFFKNFTKVILVLDYFFLKYEGGQIDHPPRKKLPSKSPLLLQLRITSKIFKMKKWLEKQKKNVFVNNISTNMKLSKVLQSKIF